MEKGGYEPPGGGNDGWDGSDVREAGPVDLAGDLMRSIGRRS